MNWPIDSTASVMSSVRAKLETLPQVERAFFDEQQSTICLICRPSSELSGVTEAARAVVREEGLDPDTLRVEVAVRADGLSGGRARFEGMEVIPEPERMVRVRVTLEWDGRRVTGEAVGERGETIELRTSVSAAITALEELTGSSLNIRLAGVKQIRAFDAELMVVSLYRPGMPSQKLVGTVLMGPDHHRAAALALLNALNRVLGNYFTTR
jgi:hypothetical protein